MWGNSAGFAMRAHLLVTCLDIPVIFKKPLRDLTLSNCAARNEEGNFPHQEQYPDRSCNYSPVTGFGAFIYSKIILSKQPFFRIP
jgi:hypothetical protein